MAEILSLNRARKAKAKGAKAAQAEVNRVKFGRTRAERVAELANAKRHADLLDGAKRDQKDD